MPVSYTENINEIGLSDLAFNVTAGIPTGGSYSGSGIIGTTFHPGLAGVGTHAIVYSVLNSNGCYSTDTSYIMVYNNSGIDDNNSNALLVYPNPTKDIVYLSNTLTSAAEILTNEGKLLFESDLEPNGNVDFSFLPDGIYQLKLKNSNGISVIKIIKHGE